MALLDEAVRLRLMSDVPFGAFLSGGIDSSAIVAMMARHMDRPVKTFSIGFAEKSFDERPYARRVAERYGTEHHELVVEPEKEILDLLPMLVEHTEEPTADSSALPVFLVSRLAREHVTMVLSGDGGDEVFAGYETHNAWAVAERWRKRPGLHPQRDWCARWSKRSPSAIRKSVSSSRPSDSCASPNSAPSGRTSPGVASSTRNCRPNCSGQNLVGPPPFERHKHHFANAGTDDPLGKMLYVDTRFYLPGDMLVKVDRMSMATSLEARVPFLDHRLVEYAAKIPSQVKFPGGKKKYLLKKGLEPLLDRDLLYRKKAGFNVPKNQWLRGPLRELVGDMLAPERLQRHGLLDPAVVRQMVNEHQQRRADHSFAIWSVLIFQLWYDRFVAGN